jgi:hypothetical protein
MDKRSEWDRKAQERNIPKVGSFLGEGVVLCIELGTQTCTLPSSFCFQLVLQIGSRTFAPAGLRLQSSYSTFQVGGITGMRHHGQSVFETGVHWLLPWLALKTTIFLSPFPGSWDYGCVLPHLTFFGGDGGMGIEPSVSHVLGKCPTFWTTIQVLKDGSLKRLIQLTNHFMRFINRYENQDNIAPAAGIKEDNKECYKQFYSSKF